MTDDAREYAQNIDFTSTEKGDLYTFDQLMQAYYDGTQKPVVYDPTGPIPQAQFLGQLIQQELMQMPFVQPDFSSTADRLAKVILSAGWNHPGANSVSVSKEDFRVMSAKIEEYGHQRRQFMTPPRGWFPFGTHIDRPDIKIVETWGDEGGVPIWERPEAVSQPVEEPPAPEHAQLLVDTYKTLAERTGLAPHIRDLLFRLGAVVAGKDGKR